MAVAATLSKGYDLEYIWKQVNHGPARDAAELLHPGQRKRRRTAWDARRPGHIPPRRTRTRSGVVAHARCCRDGTAVGAGADAVLALVAVKSSPRALWHVELAKMMGGCYLCSTGGMLLAVSIAFSDRTESQ